MLRVRRLAYCRFAEHQDKVLQPYLRLFMQRRVFSREFKLEAVELVTKRGVAIAGHRS
jgi:transposase-like protein